MSNGFFESGRQAAVAGDLDWDANTMKIMLISATADTGIKIITAASNATPIVITSNSHGFSNGDVVVIGGILGNLAANGKWVIANQATNTFELVGSVGSAAYVSGGYAINMGTSASGNFIDDFDGARVGTDQTLTTKTNVSGVIDADDPSWVNLTGSLVIAAIIYKDTGTPATSIPFVFLDGYQDVVAAATAASSATTLWVEPLAGPILNGTAIVFSNGVTATLSVAGVQGDRSLTVTALPSGIAAGSHGAAPSLGAGFPFLPSGATNTAQFDNGPNKIGKI